MFGELCGYTNVTQDELQTLRNESSDLVRERDRLKEDISTLETSCSDKSGEIERLNSQLETTSAELKVKTLLNHRINFTVADPYSTGSSVCYHFGGRSRMWGVSNYFCPAMRCISAAYVVMRCLSVRHVCKLCQNE